MHPEAINNFSFSHASHWSIFKSMSMATKNFWGWIRAVSMCRDGMSRTEAQGNPLL